MAAMKRGDGVQHLWLVNTVRVHVVCCCVPAAAAPKQPTPLFSAEYLAERELNRTGAAPEALLAKSASSSKLSRSPSSSSKKTASAKPKPTITVTPDSPVTAAPVTAGTSSDNLSESELSTNSGKDVESLAVLQPVDAKAASAGAKGLALPFKPMSVAFKDICYYVDAPGVRWGYCRGGEHVPRPLPLFPSATSWTAAAMHVFHAYSDQPDLLACPMFKTGSWQ
jgi:hypothetical protein